MMRLTGKQCKQLTDALVDALRTKEVVRRVVRFGLNERLDVIVGGDNLTDIVFNLVMWVESQERIEELIVAAREENPGNSQLKAVSEEILAVKLEVPQEKLEAIVFASAKFQDIEPWLTRLWQCSAAVCRIEINGFSNGTGFLLGPDCVITNYHVMQDIISYPGTPHKVVLRFDYKTGPDGRGLSVGVECSLADKNWLLTYSPVRQWDYALLRIDTSQMQHNGYKVSWLTPHPHKFTIGEPICIIQHPQGNPQKIAVGSVVRVTPSSRRVYYTVNTLNGSSGSPCINSDGDIIALHRGQGDDASNEGIPFWAIIRDLQQKGLWA